MDSTPIEVTVTSLGQMGDGIAPIPDEIFGHDIHAYIPNTLPGETVIITPKALSSSRLDAELVSVLSPSEHRAEARCAVADDCGGCQTQIMTDAYYQDWKSHLVRSQLADLAIAPSAWQETMTVAPHGRRRARLAYRCLAHESICGFRMRRSHHIVPPTSCSILIPAIMDCITALTQEMLPCLEKGSAGDVSLTATDTGIDMVFHPETPIKGKNLAMLIDAASRYPIDRLSIQDHDTTHTPQITLGFMKRHPTLTWHGKNGAFTLYPAAGSFLQADKDAEYLMQETIRDALEGVSRVLDLFCGCGTLSLPLLKNASPPKRIQGYDTGTDAIAAMNASAKAGGYVHHVDAKERNLMKEPLTADEINAFDAAIIDPPRAGAIHQMSALAESQMNTVIMVSCNPRSFARDAKVLLEGDFTCRSIRMIDQFLRTSHSELIAVFERD